MTDPLPHWVYDLIAVIDDYEEVHGSHEQDWDCFADVLGEIPEQERDRARAIAFYNRMKPKPEPTVIHRTEYVAAQATAAEMLAAAGSAVRASALTESPR